MALVCSHKSFLRRRHAFLLVISVYLLVGLALAAPASAEHLSHKRSHARKSLELPNSNAKRVAAPVEARRQRIKRSLLDLDLPGLGLDIGDDGTLLGITAFPNSSSASVSASTTSATDSADSASSTSSSASASSSAVNSSPSSAPSSRSTTTPDSSSSSSSPNTSSTAVSVTTSSETPTEPSTSCAVGLQIGPIGAGLACTPVSSSSSDSPSSSSSPLPATTTDLGSSASSSASSSPTSDADSTNSTSADAGGSSSVSSVTSSGGASTTAAESGTVPASTSSSVSPGTSSEQCDGVISIDLLGNPLCILPTDSAPMSSSGSVASPTAPATSAAPSSDSGSSVGSSPSSADEASSTCSGLLCGILPTPTSQPASSAESSSSTSEICTGLLCGILPTPTSQPASSAESVSSTSEDCTGLLCGILPTSSTTATDTGSGSATVSPSEPTGSGSSSSEAASSSTCSGLLCGILPTQTSTDSESSTAGPSTSSDASPTCSGLLCTITSDLPTITSAPPETTTTGTPGDNSTSTETVTSAPSEGTNTATISEPVVNGTSTSTPVNATTTTLSTSETSITFPTGNITLSAASNTSSLITLTPTPTITTSVPSQFSFLTQSSLLFSDVTSSSLSSLVTLTNPDEPTSSATLESALNGATVTSVPLPSGLPARIYPAEGGVTADMDLNDYTSVSILFDNTLLWPFVASTTDSAAQIFAYFPPCLQVALGISSDQVKTFALQVLETSEYKSPSDLSELRTLFIAYIPSSNVTALEQAIKAKQSDLYTRTAGISAELAQRIDASFSVTSYPDPISENPNSSNSSAASSGSDSRRDAIIGVCSALGGIALCILAFLVYRNFKRRQEVAHHRLVEPQLDAGPVPGQDFDRDSIGGQRRRSFYYAEDSLRGFSQPPYRDEGYAHHVSPAAGTGSGMRERRPIVPGAISAPILRDNTLNW